MRETVLGKDGLCYCKTCGERVERIVYFPMLDGSGEYTQKKVRLNCKCDLEARANKEQQFQFEELQKSIHELQKLSLMDARLKEIKFDTYEQTVENQKVLELSKRYVARFDLMYQKGQGILFWGDVGTGKSYTAAAIANELIQRNVSVIMTSFIKLLASTKRFELEDDDLLERLNRAKLLIIDDLGAERGTDYALEKVYDIVDSRYRTGKPMILTTNLDFADMKRCSDIRYNRIYDRIFEMCYPVKMEGMSWRKKGAVSKFEEMKKLLEA